LPKNRVLVLMLLFALGVTLVGCGSAPAEVVYVRIHNDSLYQVKNFWLGSGGYADGRNSEAYGTIAPYAMTDYRRLPNHPASYRKFSMVTRGNDQRVAGLTFDNIESEQQKSGERYSLRLWQDSAGGWRWEWQRDE
jgi:hypothetical protein